MPTCAKNHRYPDIEAGKRNYGCPKCAQTIRIETAGIPKRYKNATIDRNRSEDKLLRNYNFDHDLLLTGGVGTGKTHAACALALFLVQRKKSVRYFTLSNIIDFYREGWARDSETVRLEQLVEPNLLIIDELTHMAATDDKQRILFEIINGRNADLKPTLIITNLTASATELVLGERIFDRLREPKSVGGPHGQAIAFTGSSMRVK